MKSSIFKQRLKVLPPGIKNKNVAFILLSARLIVPLSPTEGKRDNLAAAIDLKNLER
jgi:hypothetical protein